MDYNQFNNIKMPPSWKNYTSYYRIIIPGILVIILLWTTFFQIGPEEIGVITRFGKYKRDVEPGLNLKVPIIETLYKVPVERQQKQEFGFRTISAGVAIKFAIVPVPVYKS